MPGARGGRRPTARSYRSPIRTARGGTAVRSTRATDWCAPASNAGAAASGEYARGMPRTSARAADGHGGVDQVVDRVQAGVAPRPALTRVAAAGVRTGFKMGETLARR